jgi:peptide deformylase
VSVDDWTEHDLGVPGFVLPVLRAPHAALDIQTQPVDPTDPKIVQLAADLVATMRESPGCVGLAAPQVGTSDNVFCVDVSGHPKTRVHHGTFVLCNTKIVDATSRERGREGCMSVPDLTGDISRAAQLTVVGSLPGSGDQVRIETDAFEARAIQHEIDHCAGLLFLDRVAGAHAVYRRRTYL